MNPQQHLSSETLDLLLLSALAEDERHKARAHLEGCGSCKQRWTQLEEDSGRFTKFVLPRTLPQVEAKVAQVSLWDRLRRHTRLLYPAMALGAAAVLVVVVTPRVAGDADRAGMEEPLYGLKGGARVEVVAQQGDAQRPVTDETVLTEGDRIRFLVEPAGAPFLLLASQDGEGAFTVYFPYGGSHSASLSEGFVELPGSIELDDAPGPETLFAVFSSEPVDASLVQAALRDGRELAALPAVVEVLEKRFQKGPGGR